MLNSILTFFQHMFAPNQTSEQFSLNVRDFAKGVFIAGMTAPITIIGQSVSAGEFTFDWKMIAKVALAGAVSYLGKNFLSVPAK